MDNPHLWNPPLYFWWSNWIRRKLIRELLGETLMNLSFKTSGKNHGEKNAALCSATIFPFRSSTNGILGRRCKSPSCSSSVWRWLRRHLSRYWEWVASYLEASMLIRIQILFCTRYSYLFLNTMIFSCIINVISIHRPLEYVQNDIHVVLAARVPSNGWFQRERIRAEPVCLAICWIKQLFLSLPISAKQSVFERWFEVGGRVKGRCRVSLVKQHQFFRECSSSCKWMYKHSYRAYFPTLFLGVIIGAMVFLQLHPEVGITVMTKNP